MSGSIVSFLWPVFIHEGCPAELVSDHNRQFMSAEFEVFLKDRGVKNTFSSVYYSQSNGQIGHFKRVFEDFVQLSAQEQRPLKEAVVEYLGVYRCTPHTANCEKPAFLLHGHRPKTKLAIVGGPSRDFLRNRARHLASLREHMAQYQWKSKAYTDPPGSQGQPVRARRESLHQAPSAHSKRPHQLLGFPRRGRKCQYAAAKIRQCKCLFLGGRF